MDFTLKNIILYDNIQNVSGFAEFKIRADQTNIKVRHNLECKHELLLSMVADGEKSYVFTLIGPQTLLELKSRINPEREIFICIMKRENTELQTLASGIINQDRKNLKTRAVAAKEIRREIEQPISISTQRPIEQLSSIKEIDDVLRKVCIIDDEGKGQCETCPYRDHFYQFALTEVK